jgi:hypothetical protein
MFGKTNTDRTYVVETVLTRGAVEKVLNKRAEDGWRLDNMAATEAVVFLVFTRLEAG